MNLTAKITGVTLAAAVLCGLGAAAASAATPNAAAMNVAVPASASAPGHAPGHTPLRLRDASFLRIDISERDGNNTYDTITINDPKIS